MDSSSNKQTSYTSNQEPTTDQPHRSDPKLGGFFNDQIAFVRNRDIWVTDWHGNDTQLTFCASDTSDPTLKCGVAEYMMQVSQHDVDVIQVLLKPFAGRVPSIYRLLLVAAHYKHQATNRENTVFGNI